jgi:malate dehydrogenase (oxaloacetate-decarboxylating)
MMVAAASAIADSVEPGELNASFIIPSVFDASVAPAVAAAVRAAAGAGVEASASGESKAGPRTPLGP